jgi:hypothetical protein
MTMTQLTTHIRVIQLCHSGCFERITWRKADCLELPFFFSISLCDYDIFATYCLFSHRRASGSRNQLVTCLASGTTPAVDFKAETSSPFNLKFHTLLVNHYHLDIPKVPRSYVK